jgi:hypothetical protein
VAHDDDTASDPVDILLGGLDRLLDAVHDRIVRPLLLVTRYLAFGFVLFTLATVALVAGLLGLIRFGNVFIFQGLVWLNYLVVGALSTIIGLVIWRRRRPPSVRKS